MNNTADSSAGPGQGSDQAPITSDLSATVVQDRVIDVGSVADTDHGGIDLGRQMLGTVSGTHTLTSTGADSENTRLTFRADAENVFGGYAASGLEEIRATNAAGEDVVLNGSTSAEVAYEFDFTQTGARDNDAQYILFNTGNAFDGEGLAGETPLSDQPTPGNNQVRVYIQNATIVDNREIDATTVDLGSVLVGTTTDAQSTTLTTSGDDEHRTRVTVDGDSVTTDGVTIVSGDSHLFDSADAETTRSVTGNFDTSGSKNVDVDFSVTGEGLAGESVNAVTVNATAEVYQAADLSANNEDDLQGGDTISVGNSATTDVGGQRAAAEIFSRVVAGNGWSVDGLNVGSEINEGDAITGTVGFDASASGLLNGATATGSLQLGFQHADQSIQGTSFADLGTTQWNFSQEVSGNVSGSGSATVGEGDSMQGLGIQSDAGSASILAGTTSLERNISMELAADPTGFGVPGAEDALGEYLSLTGTGGDTFALSLGYTGVPEDGAYIHWWNGSAWVNAVLGNTGGSPNFLGDVAFNPDIHFSLGNYGFDSGTSTAWAVLNHNSAFVVVPEPGTAALAALSLGLLVFRRRRGFATRA